MRPYLLVTGTVFALIVIAHVWRVVAESTRLARDPWFLFLTCLAAALSIWAFALARRAGRPTS